MSAVAILFLKGIVIGLAVSAPIGPVGVLVLRRSMLYGFAAGLLSGLGAAIVDGALSGVIGLGLAQVSDFVQAWGGLFRAFGGLFLLVIGWWVWHTSPPHQPRALPPRQSAIAEVASTMALTLSNPMTILGLTGILAGLGVVAAVDTHFHAGVLVGGVFAGSLGWWFILSGIGKLLRDRVSGTLIRRINQGCGIGLALLGVAQIILLLIRNFSG